MVIRLSQRVRCGAFLILEAVVALGILTIAVLPLAYGIRADLKSIRVTYQRAIADEIVDGELEVLAVGAWRNFPEGASDYQVKARAATNLPDGRFVVSRAGNRVRLEWTPDGQFGVGKVVREVIVK